MSELFAKLAPGAADEQIIHDANEHLDAIEDGDDVDAQTTAFLLRELVRRLGRKIEATSASDATKAAYAGEFKLPVDGQLVNVPWSTLQEIMKAIRRRSDDPEY